MDPHEALEQSKSRPLTPADNLVADLEKLRVLLHRICDRLDKSGVERTFHLRRILGADCQHYRKSMALFVDEDFESLKDLVYEIDNHFKLIEGKLSSTESTHG